MSSAAPARSFRSKWIPYLVVLPFFLWALAGLRPRQDKPEAFALQEFGRLPVLTTGRVQPIDSLARNSLLQLREKQTANTAPWESNPKIISATEWALEMMANPALADTRPVFRIDHPEVKSLLGLPGEENKAEKNDGKHYSWSQIQSKLRELQTEAQRVGGVEASQRTTYDQAISKVWNGVTIYMRLQNTLQPQNAKNWAVELQDYLANVPAGVAAARAQKAGRPFDQAAFDRTMEDLQRFDTMVQLEAPSLIPPPHPETARAAWERTGNVLMEVARGEPAPLALTAYARMADAFKTKSAPFFNQALTEYRHSLEQTFQPELSKAASEQLFNAFAPFIKALTIYVVAALLVLVYWFNPEGWHVIRRCALGLVLLALVIHTSGLVFRMLLEGRPPVTNLYSSAIFIGVGACMLGVLLELFWFNGVGLMVASVIGFSTLIIAHHLALSGDTMEMMRAVLDSNFWLATHVVVVTLGYASTFVAGALAITYILLGVFTKTLDSAVSPETASTVSLAKSGAGAAAGQPKVKVGASLNRMVYAIICFATLFSFVGTVLGGIWADQSWGRFWGWDPKENGALIIVLWNALVLHARWGGLVKERGLMNLVICGNIVTAWSWFGVNMLGIGLHSYGFTDSAFKWLVGFVVSQLIFIGIGLLPRTLWRSGVPAPADRVTAHGSTPRPLPA